MSPLSFPLEALRPLLESYTPPDLPPPGGDGHVYRFDLLTLTRQARNIGRFEMRVREGGAGVLIEFSMHRPSEGPYNRPDRYVYRSEFRYEMEGPGIYLRRWEARCWTAMVATEDQPLPLTGLRASGERVLRGYQLRLGKRTRQLPTARPIAAKWPLLEGVRRIAEGRLDWASPLERIDCLDEYAMILEDHRVGRGASVVMPGGFEVQAFLHTGRAQVPRVIYADALGRPLAYVSGSEAAILTGLDDATGGYKRINYDFSRLPLPAAFTSEGIG
jgi:hypothetical protein